MSKELTRPVHRRATLFQHDMNSNEGEQEAWTEVEVTDIDWSNDYYVELNDGDSLTSIRSFRYGVLTFDMYGDSVGRNNFRGGFRVTNVDYGGCWYQNFITNKHNTGAQTTAGVGLAALTWYHFVIKWCPQFISMEIYLHDGTPFFYAKHRNPPNRPMPIYFISWAGVVWIGGVTLQEGDDPEFFRPQRDHVAARLAIWGGATWSTSDILINAALEMSYFEGSIRAGMSRVRMKFFYFHLGAPNNTNIQLWMQRARCGVDQQGVWNLINARAVNLASTVATQIECYQTEWFGLEGVNCDVYGAIEYMNGDHLYIRGVELEFE